MKSFSSCELKTLKILTGQTNLCKYIVNKLFVNTEQITSGLWHWFIKSKPVKNSVYLLNQQFKNSS